MIQMMRKRWILLFASLTLLAYAASAAEETAAPAETASSEEGDFPELNEKGFLDSGEFVWEDAEGGEIPVARRKMGWRFLLAQADEVAHIRTVEMDSCVVMRRIAGQLIDYARFEERAKAALGDKPSAINERVLALYDYIERRNRALGLPVDADSIAAEFGFTAKMISDIEAACGFEGNDWNEDGDESR